MSDPATAEESSAVPAVVSESAAVTPDSPAAAEKSHSATSAQETPAVAGPSHSPAEATPADGEEEGFRAEFRARLISLRAMTPQLRLLTGLASVLFLVAVVMIWQQRLFGEGLLTVRSNGAQARVAQSVLLVGATLFAAAWTLTIVAVTALPRHEDTNVQRRRARLSVAVVGAYSLFAVGQIANPSALARVSGCFVLLAIVWFVTARWWRRWTYRLVGVAFLMAATAFVAVNAGPRSCALLLVAALWLLCRRETTRAGSDGEVNLAFALLVFGLVAGFESVTWLTLGAQEAGTHMLGWVVWIAFFVLAPVLMLAGTEIADLGAALGQGALAQSVRREHGALRALAVTTVVAVLDVVLAVLFLSWVVVASAIAVLGLTCAFGAIVFRVQAFRARDRMPVPARLLIILAVGLAIVLSLTAPVGDIETWAFIGLLASVGLGIACIAPASPADKLRPRSASRFLTLAALCAVAVSAVTVVLLHFVLPVSFTNLAWGFGGAIGAGTLIAVAWLLGVRREPLGGLTPLLRQLFALNLGASVIALVAVVLAEASAAGERLSKWQAAVIFVALVWDFATSGAETNRDGTTLPRQRRVLLFLSYLLAVAAGVLLLRQSRLLTLPAETPPPFDSELLTRSGLLMLGYPVLFFLLLPRLAGAAAELRRPGAEPFGASSWRRLTNARAAVARQAKDICAHLPRPLEHAVRRVGATLAGLALLIGIVIAMIGPNLLLLAGLQAGQGPAPQDWKGVVSRSGDFELQYPPDWTVVPGSGEHLVDVYGPAVTRTPLLRPHLYVERLPASDSRPLGTGAACAEGRVRRGDVTAGPATSFRCSVAAPGQATTRLDGYIIRKGADRYALVVLTWPPGTPGPSVTRQIARSFTFI